MNPLDLPGPAFLKFYLIFGAIVIAIAYWIRGRLQNADPPHRAVQRFSEGHYPKESEAYHIAYLRGGVDEFTRTARVAAAIATSPLPAFALDPRDQPGHSDRGQSRQVRPEGAARAKPDRARVRPQAIPVDLHPSSPAGV